MPWCAHVMSENNTVFGNLFSSSVGLQESNSSCQSCSTILLIAEPSYWVIIDILGLGLRLGDSLTVCGN